MPWGLATAQKEMRSRERRQKSKGNEEAVGVKQGVACVLRWCHCAGWGMLQLLPLGPRKGLEQPCLAGKSQSALAGLCDEEQPSLLKKLICRCVPNREELRPARSKLDELLGRGPVAKILEQPGVGERREFQLDKKYQKQPGDHRQGHQEGLQRRQHSLGRARLISSALAGEILSL